jgi:hypothetical protein
MPPSDNIRDIQKLIAHNVPAVYEGFYGAIKKCAAFCAIKTLGGVRRENEVT